MTNHAPPVVLVVGATGRTGRLVVEALARHDLLPRALARDADRARHMFPDAAVVHGDLEDPGTLTDAVAGADAVVFAHGSDNDARADALERIDYGGVAQVLRALDGRRPRVALVSTFFVTHRDHYFNDGGRALDWKRRSEHLVRASGVPHTIVRPGWLDRTTPGHDAVEFRQGDQTEAGVTRRQVAETVAQSLVSDAAVGRTSELFAAPGPALRTSDWQPLFSALKPDVDGSLAAFADPSDLPLSGEPASVRHDVAQLSRSNPTLTNEETR